MQSIGLVQTNINFLILNGLYYNAHAQSHNNIILGESSAQPFHYCNTDPDSMTVKTGDDHTGDKTSLPSKRH